jgi:hypothetical protein
MIADTRPARHLWWCAVAALALAGLMLRIAAARGGLWTDEAWSAINAHVAGDPLGVFLRINSDNNHHLYSLWLQAIGLTAPPLLARLPAIVAGTASIVLAAALGRRQSPTAGLVAALLFAVSPVLVTFGSEARGYALMLAAVLAMLLLVTSASGQRGDARTAWWLGLCATLGMLSHLTMAAPVGLIALWVYLDRRRDLGPAQAPRATARLMGPALAATAAVAAFVLAAAAASPTGMRLGGYVPFGWGDFGLALDNLSGWTIGVSAIGRWLGPLLIAGVSLALFLRPPAWLGARGRLYAILILGLPLAVALIHPGNASFPRYYLASAVGLLLLVSEWLGRGLAQHGRLREASAAALAAILLVCLWHDGQLVRAQRGHPDQALALIAQRSPAGARVALGSRGFAGVLTVAADRAGYALSIVDGCAPAAFVVAAQPRFGTVPATILHCGVAMRALGAGAGTPLTGDRWTLYGVEGLQTAGPPVSGPAPGALTSRHAVRAGVAQG